MKKVYRDINGRPYMIKEAYGDDSSEESVLGLDLNKVKEFIERITTGKQYYSYGDSFEDVIEYGGDAADDVNWILGEFISDFDPESVEDVVNTLKGIGERKYTAILRKILRNYTRLRRHNMSERYDILMDMVEDAREADERSFNYDPDKVNFDELEFDKTDDTEFNAPAPAKQPAQEQPIDDDAKNFMYALDQELKLDEPDRSHFYITLKNDPDTDYEVIVLGKQSASKYLFNIFMEDGSTTIKTIPVSDIDLDATMVDSDSLW